jgi:tight adherence protein C
MTGSVLLVALVVGALAAARWRRRLRLAAEPRRRAEEVLDEVIDLIAVVVGSGGTISSAVELVAEVGPPAVAPTFAAVLDRAADGCLLADALVSVSDELGPVYHPLVGALVGCERDGTPIAGLLQRLADEADLARRHRVEAATGRLPVMLLVPLVVCLLPAVVIGVLIPLAVVALGQLL